MIYKCTPDSNDYVKLLYDVHQQFAEPTKELKDRNLFQAELPLLTDTASYLVHLKKFSD